MTQFLVKSCNGGSECDVWEVVGILRALRTVIPSTVLPSDAFLSKKLNGKLQQQLQDALTLAAHAEPSWYFIFSYNVYLDFFLSLYIK